MTCEVRMVPIDGKPEVGRAILRDGFQGTFDDYPDYKIHIQKVARCGNDVAVVGRTTGSHIPAEIEARETVVWVAKIEGNLVAEWRIFSDMEQISERHVCTIQPDPKYIALQFNEFINCQDINGLSNLMTEDHQFIDRADEVTKGKETMIQGWIDFFKAFPDYYNIFERVHSHGDQVILYGYGTWRIGGKPDYAIWVARIKDNLVAEWRIYEDTVENQKMFSLS
jgi:ketosteroid isomerase-like protein